MDNTDVSVKEVANNIQANNFATIEVHNYEGEPILNIKAKRYLSIAERTQMIDGVVRMCFPADESGKESYRPYFVNFALAYNAVLFYTDVDLKSMNSEEISALLFSTDIIDVLSENLPGSVIDCGDDLYEIFGEAREYIRYKKDLLLQQNKLNDLLVGASNVLKQINDFLRGTDFNGLMDYLENKVPGLKEEVEKATKEIKENIP